MESQSVRDETIRQIMAGSEEQSGTEYLEVVWLCYENGDIQISLGVT